ncbi:Efflux pump ustT-like protein [Cladobotryum mycophilum]|uniref:Efflux pump ustT-like protein n=1 Tax=Cladobotryum mycophilum TaxID=491253 RepID=A0ABR0S7W7_9HYPO
MPEYGTSQSDSKTSTQIDVQSLASSDATITITPTLTSDEETPLMQDNDGPVVPKSLRRFIISMAVFMFLLKNINGTMRNAPMLKIMEDIICRDYYSDHLLWIPGGHDLRCKDIDVQKTLAMVKSWTVSSHLLVAVIVQIPYGILADKYGRRPILCLALLGCVINQIWLFVVLLFPDNLSIWSIIFSGLSYFVGGGVPIANAIIYTLVTDVTPASERSTIFSRILALVILPGIVMNPICAFLMDFSPWIPMWIAFAADVIAFVAALFIPETMQLRQQTAKKDVEASFSESYEPDTKPGNNQGLWQQARSSIQNDVSHLWQFVFGSKTIMLFVTVFSVCAAYKLALLGYMLQYMTKRFNMEWSTATYLSTIYELSSAVVFMFILPLASRILTNRFGYDSFNRDLLLAKISVAVAALSSLIGGLASTPWLFMLSLPLGNLGDGYIALFRAILNALVEPHAAATLNTTISTVETLFQMLATPLFGWILGKGMEFGGAWTGLPYFAGCLFGTMALTAMLVYQVPKGITPSQR